MDEGIGFVVFQREGCTGFENRSDWNLVISVKPVKPKRKYTKVIIVAPKSYKMFTDKDMQIDLTKISFTLEKP